MRRNTARAAAWAFWAASCLCCRSVGTGLYADHSALVGARRYFVEMDLRDGAPLLDRRPFFALTYLYGILTYDMGLGATLDDADIYAILSTTLKRLRRDAPVGVYFPRGGATGNLQFAYADMGGSPGIAAVANLRRDGGLAAAADEHYTKLFVFGPDGKLVRVTDLSTAPHAAGLDANLTADRYLFDELPGNDGAIRPLLWGHVVNEKNPYRLWVGRMRKAAKLIGQCATAAGAPGAPPAVRSRADAVLRRLRFIHRFLDRFWPGHGAVGPGI
jgi:hypothetical protein